MKESINKTNSFILFGILGDLSIRKLIPAWYYLERDNMLSESLEILGVGRQDISDSELKLKIKKALSNSISSEYLDAKIVSRLLEQLET